MNFKKLFLLPLLAATVAGLAVGVANNKRKEELIMKNILKAISGKKAFVITLVAAILFTALDVISNIVRSIPFLILLILLIPFTRFVVGQSYGSNGVIVPLVVCASAYIARVVESSLNEVDHGIIEAAKSMGANNIQIVFKVLLVEAKTSLITGFTITTGLLLGYSAMSGTVGGGGLGDIAVRYGYHRWQADIMITTVILLIIIFQIIQYIGTKIASSLDHRKR